MRASSPTPNSGFTLLEVLLVSLLLFFLATTLFQVVRATISAKEDIDQKTEILQGARAALSMMERDLRAAYLVTTEDLGWYPVTPKSDGTIPAPVKPTPVTIFQGHESDVFFSTRTHQRLYVDAPENEEHFVTYQLSNDELIRAESARAVSLFDRENPDKFHQFKLLGGVKSFKLSYWDDKNDRWGDKWDTDGTDTKDTLPPAVKIYLEFLPDPPANSRRKVEIMKLTLIVRPVEAVLKSPIAAFKTQAMQGVTSDPNGAAQ
ncbi:MAG: hypothetical protein JST16_11340 [Bdellovibrionales bacterium]|nr:hypothetical protein [Bdellovibrionales bacterium]